MEFFDIVDKKICKTKVKNIFEDFWSSWVVSSEGNRGFLGQRGMLSLFVRTCSYNCNNFIWNIKILHHFEHMIRANDRSNFWWVYHESKM